MFQFILSFSNKLDNLDQSKTLIWEYIISVKVKTLNSAMDLQVFLMDKCPDMLSISWHCAQNILLPFFLFPEK